MSHSMIHVGDCRHVLRSLPAGLARCVVTSPPYWGLRDYGHEGQLGLEPTLTEYVANLVETFREVRRVLRDDGTLWLNLGDCYAGSWGARGRGENTNAPQPEWEARHGVDAPARNPRAIGLKSKDLVGIPWRVAFALQEDGWYLRSDIIWSKPNGLPESVADRPTKSHEYLFLLTKNERYFYDQDAIREPHGKIRKSGPNALRGQSEIRPRGNAQSIAAQSYNELGRNRRTVWEVPTRPFHGAHFATFPPKLIEPCILAGSAVGDVVLDPFSGAGTTGVVASRHGRNYVGIEINPGYAEMGRARIVNDAPLFNSAQAIGL